MRKIYRVLLIAAVFILAAASIAGGFNVYNAKMSGEFEVPINNSPAMGKAIFRVSGDGTQIYYKLIVNNIDNVFMSHIHLAAAGQNGPIVVWLYPDTPNPPDPTPPNSWIPGTFNGKLASGVITADNLVGPLAGAPLSDLISAMQSGNAYVNVHTNDFVAPTNTGPGDFPGGEIRGQIFK